MKQKKWHREGHLSKAGICFEALEPRLLLSGSWGAVVNGPGADTQADTRGGLTQGSVVSYADAGITGVGSEHRSLAPENGRVDLLSQAPVLNPFGNAVPALDASSASIPVAPVAEATISSLLADQNDATSNTKVLPETMESVVRRELVFVNDDVAAYEILIDGIRESDTNRIIEIVVLDADRDGIKQVSDILANRSDLSAVHVIAHGSDGQINLGNSWLNSTTLQQKSDAVASWGQALTETGDILFYGCNIAAGSDGQGLLDNITELTGAEVAASGDLTGSATFGGNWELEFTVGDIETSVAVNAEMQDNWSGVLVTATNVGTVADKSAAHTQTQITVGASGVSAGNTVIIAIALNFSNGEDLDVPTATDSQGNTYNTDIDVFPDGTAARLAIISSDITTPLTSGDTVTVTHAPSAASTMSVQEFSGLLSSGALDQTASSFGDSSTASSGSTATTSQANELVFGATLVKGPVTQTFTEGGTYTLIGRDGTTGAAALSNRTINPEYKIVSSTGTYAADGTLGTSATWISAVATYKLAPAANQAPVVTASVGTTAYTEQAAATVIDAGMTLIDADGFDGVDPSDQYTAVIRITGNYEAADTLGFTNTANIQGVLAGDTLSLSVIGGQTATVADFQAALQSVTFYNGSDTPGELDRTISFSFDDGVDSSNIATKVVTVTAVNDAPTFIGNTIGYWNFDEGSGDSVAESAIGLSTGTLGSTVGADANDPTWTTGKFGQALHFDGVNDYIEIADAPGIDISGPQFSASLWMNPDSGPNQEDMLFMKGDRQGNINYYLSWKNSNEMTWAFKDGAGWHYQDMAVTMPTTGQWNHIGITFDRPTVTLYVNGTKYVFDDAATGGSMDRDLTANNEVLWIGAGRDAGALVGVNQYSGPFTGSIDDLALFDRTLTDAEIEAIRTSTPPAVTASAFSIDENSANNTVVGNVIANDQDIGDTLSYAITAGNTGGAFSIDANGQIKVANSAALDFETNPTFNLTIEATDDGTPAKSDTTSVSISLNDVNDAPIDLVATSTTDGGLSLNEDGGNDVYFVADDGGGLLGGLTTVTIEASFSVTTPGGDLTPLLSYADGANDEELALFLKSDGRIWFGVSSNGSPIQSTTGNYMQLFDGEVHHVGVSWDSSTGAVTFYVDGQQVESFVGYQTGQTITGGGELVFGQDQDSVLGGFKTFDVFSGALYDVRIFNDVRTAGEIVADYDQTLPSTEPGMIANWVFDDLSTGGIITEAVSGNDLTEQHFVGVGFTTSTPLLTFFVAEDAVNSTVIGSVSAIDPDIGDTFTFTLVDDAGGRFAVNSSTGQITLADSSLIDFESATSHDITIRVTDSGALTYDELFTIFVTDVVEISAYTIDAIADTSVDENSAFTSVTPALTGTPIGTVTYSLGGTDAALFSVDAGTGVVSMIARDYETPADSGGNNIYDLTLIATDDDGNTDSEAFSVTVNDVVEISAYTIDAIADTSVDENSAFTSVTPALTGTPIGTVTYSLGGTDAALFSVDAGTGVVSMIARDYETPADSGGNNIYDLTLIATDDDGNTDSEAFSVTVNDVVEISAYTIDAIADTSVDENSAFTSVTPALTGTPIGTVTYSLGGTDAALFSVDAGTGVVSMIARDYETPADSGGNNIYDLTLIATDDDGNTDSEAFSVTVNDVVEISAYTIDAIADTSVDENSAFTSVTPALTGTPIGTVTYSLGGTDAALFSVDAGTGVVSMIARDYETPADSGGNNIYDLTLIATDDDGNTDSEAFSVTVNDVVEISAYTIDAIADTSVDENSAFTSVTPALTGTPIGTVTYSLGGTDAALFSVDAGTGVVSMIARDYETPADSGGNNIYDLTLIATDDDGNTDSEAFSVTVNDVVEISAYTIDAIADTSVDENSAFTSVTPALTGTPIGTVTYSLGGTDAALFSVDAGTGVVSMIARDYETPADSGGNNIYDLTLIATDDDGNTDSEAFSVTVTDVADVPVATDDSGAGFSTTEDTGFTTGDVRTNDTLGDAPTTITAFDATSANGATVAYNNDGTFTYTPAAGFNGNDSFTYTITDADGETSTATVTIAVNAVNDAPTIGGSNTGAVTKNIDPDGDGLIEVGGMLTISDPDTGESNFQVGTVVGAYGSLTIDAAGNWNYAADNTQAVIQQLNTGESIHDVLTVTTADGTTHSIVVTINGATVIVDQGGDDPGPAPLADPIEPDPKPDPELPPEEIVPVDDELPPREELAVSDTPSSKLPVMTPLQWADPTYFVPTISMLTTDNVLATDDGAPSAVVSIVKRLQRELASQTIESAVSTVSALFSAEAMTQTLDHIQQQFGDTLEVEGKRGQVIIGAATGLGASVFAGYVIWAFRGSSLLLGALTAMPMWRCFDPLPVLMGDEKKRRERDEAESTKPELDKDETKVHELLGEEQAAADTESVNGRKD